MIGTVFFLLATIFVSSTCFAADIAEVEPETMAELMLFYEWNELVVTASKRPQKITESPSPIYVFTAEDIQRTGVRNIRELLKFIPGFYIYPRIDQPFVIANRGMRSSSNDKTLFLLDGIPLNNITKSGAVNADIFPDLDMVKKVEVISGPGSTMWGSDASLGIISIITKDGKDISGDEVNINLATEDNHRQVNLLSGREFHDGEYMFSATYAQNDGFGHEKDGYPNFVFDDDTIVWNDQRGNFDHIYPSYEIYAKVRFKDFGIKALASKKSVYTFWSTTQVTGYWDVVDAKSINTSKDLQLELSHHAEFASDKTLDTKITAKQIEYLRDDPVEIGTDHGPKFDDPAVPPLSHTAKFPEKGVGLEFIFNWDINEMNHLLAGASAKFVEAGPAEINYFNVNTGQIAASGSHLYYHKVNDKSYGAYVEDTFHATDKLTLIGGVRVDYNDPRETVAVVMPRGAAIYHFTDAWSVKYMYNTGYFRPSIDKSFEVALSKEGSVKESEKISSHDVALIYNTDKTQLIVDAFRMKIIDRNMYDAHAAAHVDVGDIWSHGVEVSLKRSFLDEKLFFNLNYSYATAKQKDRNGIESTYYEGIPNHLYTAGLTYLFTRDISLFVDVCGWRDLEMNHAIVTDYSWVNPNAWHPDKYSGDYLVDLNLRFANLLHNHLDLSLYVLNVTDRKARLQALDDWHSWWSYARSRSFGIKTSWKF